MDTFVYLAVWFLLFGAVGMLIGQKKGRTIAGLIWAMVLGPIGWLVIYLGPTITPQARPAVRKPTALR